MNRRVGWIDNMKAIGIILVLIGHNESSITQFIYSFHMPLFFFISGLLFVYDEEIKITTYIRKKFKSLMIPYFKISGVLFVIWYILKGRNKDALTIFKNFFGIFYSQGGHEYMNWGVPMWFIPCLFLVSIMIFIILRYTKKYYIQILFASSLIGYGLGSLRLYLAGNGQVMLRMPWSIDIMFIGIVFFTVGYKIKFKVNKVKNRKINIIFSSILFLSVMIISRINGRIDIYTLNYKNYFLFFIAAGLGVLATIYIAKYTCNSKILSKIGSNTIYLLAFHINILSFIKQILNIFIKDMGRVDEIVRIDFIAIIVIPIIQVTSIFILIYIYKRISELLKKKYFISG